MNEFQTPPQRALIQTPLQNTPITRRRRRRRRGILPHVGIQRDALFKDEWKGLSPEAKIFYVQLKAKYNGSNNGEIKLTYREMIGIKGCNGSCHRTVSNAIRELEQKEWIIIRQFGGLYRKINKYELTFKHEGYAK